MLKDLIRLEKAEGVPLGRNSEDKLSTKHDWLLAALTSLVLDNSKKRNLKTSNANTLINN